MPTSPTLFLFIGQAGAGKTTYIKRKLIMEGLVHLIRSSTTRPLRKGEVAGFPYTVRRKTFFNHHLKRTKKRPGATRFMVHIFANEETYKTDKKEWHYAVTKKEIDTYAKEGRHLVYDVIQPRYAKQLIDYVTKNYPHYTIKVAWFVPPQQGEDVVARRENMPNDTVTRKKNTCTKQDIENAGITVNYKLCPREEQFDPEMEEYIAKLYDEMMRTKEKTYGLIDIPERHAA